MIIHNDCIFFRGDIPCLPNKQSGFICESCPEYIQKDLNILIIKLGAIGDVIRTTPLLRKIRSENPNAYISWLTYTPEILNKKYANRIIPVSPENIEFLKNIEFDWVINLDKDPIAISLTKSIISKRKSGFTIDKWGHASPISNEAEEHKWITGLFDQINKMNQKHYIQEIFEICQYKFADEEYIIEEGASLPFNIRKNKVVVGLNTGCGGRWESRLWPEEYWIELAKKLIKSNFQVILLGGEQEHKKNNRISEKSGAEYYGYFTLPEFISLINQCDIIVTAVTMAMHLAIALKKQLVLFNNIFNKNEFYLYNRGVVLEPDFECDCYYSPVCKNNCMQYLKSDIVLLEINKLADASKEK